MLCYYLRSVNYKKHREKRWWDCVYGKGYENLGMKTWVWKLGYENLDIKFLGREHLAKVSFFYVGHLIHYWNPNNLEISFYNASLIDVKVTDGTEY